MADDDRKKITPPEGFTRNLRQEEAAEEETPPPGEKPSTAKPEAPWYERQARRLSESAEAAHMEDLRRAAQGQEPLTLGAKSNLLDLAARAMHTLGGVTTPKGAAMLVGGVLAPEIVGPYMAYEGGKGTLEGISKMRREGMTPENVGETLGAASEFAGGAATTGLRGGGRVGRMARQPLPGTTGEWWRQRLSPVQGPEPPPPGTIPAAGGPPPGAAPAPGGGTPATTIPPVRPPQPGPVQGPRLPTAEEQLNVPSQAIFGKNYAQLTPEQQRVAASRLGTPAAEQRVTRGQAPGGMERRAEEMPLPTNVAEAGERRVADVGPPAGELDQRAVGRDIATLTATQPMRARLLGNMFDEWKKATGRDKEVLADRIRGVQAEMQPTPGVAGRTAEPGIFKPGETVTSMKPERRMTEAEAQAESARRHAGPPMPAPGTLPLTPAATPTPGPAVPQPGGPGATLPTTPRARPTVPPAPAPQTLGQAPAQPVAPVPQGTLPTLDEILRRATGQPEPPRPGVPLGEQIGKKE